MGTACLLLTYGLLARCLAEPPGRPLDARRLALAGLTAAAAVASVQIVLGNAALLLALCAAAATVAAARRRWWLAGWIAACGAVAALSLLPYAAQLAAARRQWGIILTYPIGAGRIWHLLASTVGPRPVLVVWLFVVGVGLAAVVRELRRGRGGDKTSPDGAPDGLPEGRPGAGGEPWRTDLAAFAGLTIVAAVAAEFLFLEQLGYPPRPWYFLPLLALLASALDTVFGALERSGSRLAAVRLAAVALVAAAQVVPLLHGLTERQTNADLVALTVARSTAPQDLVVVIPWFYGVSFNRYYHGAARWLTLPDVPDHRIHRYDLLKARLAARHPLDDLFAAVAATLRSGHRVWLVGGIRWPRRGEAVAIRLPAPASPDGWHDSPYLIDWSRQLGGFLESHGARAAAVAVPTDRPVNGFEDLALTVVRGWR